MVKHENLKPQRLCHIIKIENSNGQYGKEGMK